MGQWIHILQKLFSIHRGWEKAGLKLLLSVMSKSTMFVDALNEFSREQALSECEFSQCETYLSHNATRLVGEYTRLGDDIRCWGKSHD